MKLVLPSPKMCKLWQRSLFSLACLATACALFYRIEDYRGAAAWKRYRQSAEKQGAKLDFSDFIPPPIPDEENFAAIPLLKELSSFDAVNAWKKYENELPQGMVWAQFINGHSEPDLTAARDELYREKYVTDRTGHPANDILLALRRCEPILAALRQGAAAKPRAQLIVSGWERGYGSSSLWRVSGQLELCRAMQLQSIALLGTGEVNTAFADWKTEERLSAMYHPESSLLAAMMRIILLCTAIPNAWAGINTDQWTDNQAMKIEAALRDVNLYADCMHGLASERALVNSSLDQVEAQPRYRWQLTFSPFSRTAGTGPDIRTFLWTMLIPKGWIDQNKVHLNECYDQFLRDPEDPSSENMLRLRAHEPYSFIAAYLTFPMSGNVEVARSAQAELNLCRIALALRRYCFRNGHYPDQLAELVPDFLPQLPLNPGEGEPANYRRTITGAILGPKNLALRIPAKR